MKSLTAVAATGIVLLSLSACSGGTEQAPVAEATETAAPMSATAELKDTAGNVVGTAKAVEDGGTLSITVDAVGLPAGPHGAHIHTTGDCSAADFTSAGGHWNPGNTNHGTMSDAPNPHAGDMPNLEIGEDGNGNLAATSSGNLAGLMDADGAAFVIHEKADDYKSQPSGDAGSRIACGVFAMD